MMLPKILQIAYTCGEYYTIKSSNISTNIYQHIILLRVSVCHCLFVTTVQLEDAEV